MLGRELKNAVDAADKRAQYDARAKRLLGQKIVLAHILVRTVEEFYGMNPEEVVPLIEGEPKIGRVPVEPGLTNRNAQKVGERIVGFSQENEEINEGLARFDIIFYVRMRDGLSQMIINIEAQKSEPSDYDLLNRGIFYVSRMISSQKERDFAGRNYDDMKPVYSVWVCMNMKENSLSHIRLTEEALFGRQAWKGNLGLFNIVMIGLTADLPDKTEEQELHRLLVTLLSDVLTPEEKLNIMESEYQMNVGKEMEGDVREMCNLSEGIYEKGLAIGESRGITIGEARGESKGEAKAYLTLLREGILTIQDVAQRLGISEEEVQKML